MLFKNAQAMLANWVRNNVYHFVGEDAPLSGTDGTGVNICGLGSTYIDTVTGVKYINEGSLTTPYWTPISFRQINLRGIYDDFRNPTGLAITDTSTSYYTGGATRVFGLGIAQADSGFVATHGLEGAVGRLTSSASSNTPAALGYGGATVAFKPGTNGPLVIDVIQKQITSLAARRNFVGFLGTAADGLVSPVTGSTLTLTLVQDDVSGLLFDAGLTAATRWFAPHNKADEAASILTSAAGVDTGVDVTAADTGAYQRLRVEIRRDGKMVCFIDKVQVTSIASSASLTVALAPVALVSSSTTTVKIADFKHFAAWACR